MLYQYEILFISCYVDTVRERAVAELNSDEFDFFREEESLLGLSFTAIIIHVRYCIVWLAIIILRIFRI